MRIPARDRHRRGDTSLPCSFFRRFPGGKPGKSAGGWLLMEVVIALGIFSTAVVAFIVSLNKTAELSLLARQESMVSRLVEGAVTEALTVPEMREQDYEYQLEEMDMKIKVETQPIDLLTKDNNHLEDMWLVRVTATWYQDGEEQKDMVETWRYGKLYQP